MSSKKKTRQRLRDKKRNRRHQENTPMSFRDAWTTDIMERIHSDLLRTTQWEGQIQSSPSKKGNCKESEQIKDVRNNGSTTYGQCLRQKEHQPKSKI